MLQKTNLFNQVHKFPKCIGSKSFHSAQLPTEFTTLKFNKIETPTTIIHLLEAADPHVHSFQRIIFFWYLNSFIFFLWGGGVYVSIPKLMTSVFIPESLAPF